MQLPAPFPTAELVIIGLCLLSSGFFSASETALTALSEHRVRQLLEKGEKRYRPLLLWHERPNRILTTILIGNNVVNILAAAMATLLAERLYGDSAIAITTGVLTFLVLIFGEITPKTFAKHNAEKFAPVAMGVIGVFYYMFLPLTRALTALSTAIVRATGNEVTRTGPFVTQEDLAYLINLGHREGILEQDEEQMLHSVIDFGDTLVREIMIPRTDMVGVETGITVERLREVILRAGHSRIPVFEGSIDNIVGLFFAKDLIRAADVEEGQSFRISAHLRKPYFVPEVMHISDLLTEFKRRRMHMAVVVDEFGGTSGLVTLEDVLEEIVGEIQDEYDEEDTVLREQEDGRLLAEGRISIHDLSSRIGAQFPESEGYETLGGFVTAQAGAVPQVGTCVTWRGFEFTVKEADERRVSLVEIVRLAGEGEGEGEGEEEPTSGVANGQEVG